MKVIPVTRSIMYAYACGEAAARVDTTPGEIFRSATPAAELYGYATGTPEFDAFVGAYVGVCNVRFPAGVPTDVDGRTVAVGA